MKNKSYIIRTKAGQLLVKESISELKRLLGNHSVKPPLQSKPPTRLIAIKNHPEGELSKRELRLYALQLSSNRNC